jgi:hypothetical protein
MSITEQQLEFRVQHKPQMTAADLAVVQTDAKQRCFAIVAGRRVRFMPVGAGASAATSGAAGLAGAATAEAGLSVLARSLAASGVFRPASVDHRAVQTPVKYQEDRATCVAFAILACLEAILKRRSGREVDLSEQYAHWRFMSDEGKAQCAEGFLAVRGAQSLSRAGVCEEKLCPYEDDAAVASHCSVGPDQAARAKATYGIGKYSPLFDRGLAGWSIKNTDVLEALLAEDLDVVVGFEGMWGLLNAGVLDVKRDPKGNPWPPQASHAMLAVGYVRDASNPYFIFKNSWGPAVDDAGYVKVSYDYIRVYGQCGFVVHELRTDMPVSSGGARRRPSSRGLHSTRSERPSASARKRASQATGAADRGLPAGGGAPAAAAPPPSFSRRGR